MKAIIFRMIPILLGLGLLLSDCSNNLNANDTVFHFIRHGIFLDDYQKVKAMTTFSQAKVHKLSKTISKNDKHMYGSKFSVFYQSSGDKDNKKYELLLLGAQQHVFMNVKKINGHWKVVAYTYDTLDPEPFVSLVNSKKWENKDLIIYKP